MEKEKNKGMLNKLAYLTGQIALIILIIMIACKVENNFDFIMCMDFCISVFSIIFSFISVISAFYKKDNLKTKRISIILILINSIICHVIIHHYFTATRNL